MPVSCALCGTPIIQVIAAIPFGYWETETDAADELTSTLITRRTADYQIGQCECGHVQVLHDYTEETFQALYFHSAQEAVMWHEHLVGTDAPYRNMVEFCLSASKQTAHIADFGCGPGTLLSAFSQYLPDATLYGVDFNPRHSLSHIHYRHADLNKLAPHPLWDTPMDLVCASHTLEHVLSPCDFLAALAKQLGTDGEIFIEVPDFTDNLPDELVGQANLINLQHIHYFTRDTLRAFAAKAGLDVVKARQLRTGYIPRLQVLLRPNNTAAVPPITHTATDVVALQLNQRRERYQQFAKQVSSLCAEHQQVGLWGVGADLYACVTQFPALAELIKEKRMVLFDRDYAAHQWHRVTIQDSSALSHWAYPIVLTPLLAETRIGMHRIAQSERWQVVDPFRVSLTAVDGMQQQSCKICQHDAWDIIDTLIYGDWETTDGLLKRHVSEAVIGECHHCHHVQIITPYSEDTFARIYPSNSAAPQMWPEALAEQAYADMLAFIQHPLSTSQHILDAGCGDGALLKQLSLRHPSGTFTGLDFHHTATTPTYLQLACDLNDKAVLQHTLTDQRYDLITSSHVLEHVVEPVMFLRTLAEFLTPDGTLFIEVPDATPSTCNDGLYQTNLVHPQHIHYFTADTLSVVANLAGLSVSASRHIQTDTIPRRQILLTKQAHHTEQPIKIHTSARPTICTRFAQYREKQSQWWALCQQLIETQGCAHVWGIGGDWQQLLLQFPVLEDLVASGDVVLYDQLFADLTYYQSFIRHSSALTTIDKTVLLAPFYLPTISHMKAVASDWSCHIISV